jgi:hypothetical protein
MMQSLLGYPVAYTGMVSMPRGIGSFIAMFAVGQLIGRVDTRCPADRPGDQRRGPVADDPVQPGHGQPPDHHLGLPVGRRHRPDLRAAQHHRLRHRLPQHRAEGAGLFTLIRNIGSAAGISIMQARFVSGIESHHAVLVEHARPDNPIFRAYAPTWPSPPKGPWPPSTPSSPARPRCCPTRRFPPDAGHHRSVRAADPADAHPKRRRAEKLPMSPTTKRFAALASSVSLAMLAWACTDRGSELRAPRRADHGLRRARRGRARARLQDRWPRGGRRSTRPNSTR